MCVISGENCFYHRVEIFLLYHYAIWTEKCRDNLLTPINKIFHQHIDKNMKPYIDDLLIKSRTIDKFIADLTNVFQVLWRSWMMLNPEKCVFGMKSGKFLGYMVSSREIEANSDKVKII